MPFFFLAAWMARKPPKFIEQDKSLGIYMAVAGAIGTALQLVSPSVSGIGWALWIMFWGLMLIWASIKRAAPQSAAS